MQIFAQGDLRVYTVAGAFYPHFTGSYRDGGPATAAVLNANEGIWLDGDCNLYISDNNQRVIRKVTKSTGIITKIAGNYDSLGFSGDGGPATAAKIDCYGLYANSVGDVFIADGFSNRIRRIDAVTGIITTIAGTGTSGYNGDNIPATDAQLNNIRNVYGDNVGNIYIAEIARIRKVNPAGIITTIAGNGTPGFSGNGVPATDAQLRYPHGMLFDASGNFYFADRANSIIRKINTAGIITTFAGIPDSFGFSGDGGPATAAVLSGPISFVIDYMGNMVIGDNQNNCMRKVDANTGIITTIAGVGTTVAGSDSEGVPATTANIHPEFMYLDRSGNIYYSCWCNQVRKVTNYFPALLTDANDCGETGVPFVPQVNNELSIYPNPTTTSLTIQSTDQPINQIAITNLFGQTLYTHEYNTEKAELNVSTLPTGIYFIKINNTEVRKFVKQ